MSSLQAAARSQVNFGIDGGLGPADDMNIEIRGSAMYYREVAPRGGRESTNGSDRVDLAAARLKSHFAGSGSFVHITDSRLEERTPTETKTS